MSAPLSTVVAIPVRDEAERIDPCLEALAAQRDSYGRPLPMAGIGVVLVLNNCTDETPAVVHSLRPSLPFHITVLERSLPPGRAHAGWARKLAMDAGADLLTAAGMPTPVLLTTDADGRVHPRWITANLAAIAEGADLVAGYVRADPAEHALLPPSILHRGGLESRYEWLLAELESASIPWPTIPGHVTGWPRVRASQ